MSFCLALFVELTRDVIAGQGRAMVLDNQSILFHTASCHHIILIAAMTFIIGMGGRYVIWTVTIAVSVLLLFREKYASAVFLVLMSRRPQGVWA